MTRRSELQLLVGDALELLQGYQPRSVRAGQGDEPLESLLDQCRAQTTKLAAARPEPVRLLHHFACTGGTLVSRALASQPNTVVLSELDPFSNIMLGPQHHFAPSDVIYQALKARIPPQMDTVGRMFTAALKVLHEDLGAEGRRLVIRDHTYSHYCATEDPSSRPSLPALLAPQFDLRQAITVRHPLDSFVSMLRENWARPPVRTLELYAARYEMFLDACPSIDLHYYEDFAQDPETGCRRLADSLDLPFDPRWRDFLPLVTMSGDSGRKSERIGLRPRRPLPDTVKQQLAEGAPVYDALCARLGYDPDPESPVMPRF
ncbi:sulfotransferase [Citreicella sp. C3M06]|uniref:sulfotransferase n=1 Tax=Citreicella sp. C3M06 TaxID=2841564 RepID=UPI001C0963AB|nr:sulfotransferase [Citreicella sp. C3M06]MBU2963485.1 sulfotransferase [Citreicella sp. C3M06]